MTNSHVAVASPANGATAVPPASAPTGPAAASTEPLPIAHPPFSHQDGRSVCAPKDAQQVQQRSLPPAPRVPASGGSGPLPHHLPPSPWPTQPPLFVLGQHANYPPGFVLPQYYNLFHGGSADGPNLLKRKAPCDAEQSQPDEDSVKKGKGLKHFSVKVCEEVKRQGVTTYNQVADTLVHQEFLHNSHAGQNRHLEEKNIRRRVYDALNVLLALGVVTKSNKYLIWQGISENPMDQRSVPLKAEALRMQAYVSEQKARLAELLHVEKLVDALVEMNRKREVEPPESDRHPLPFVMTVAPKNANLNCEVSDDGSEISIFCTHVLAMEDYRVVLKRLAQNSDTFKRELDAVQLAAENSAHDHAMPGQ